MLKARPKMTAISHFSILLLKHVPKEYHSHVWSMSLRQHALEPMAPRDACRGFIHAACVDYIDHSDSHIAHPTAYLRCRADQRWVVCIVPFPVPDTCRTYQGVPCQVIFTGQCEKPIDRQLLTAEMQKQATIFNDRVFHADAVRSIAKINETYQLACKSFAELVMALGHRTERMGLVEMWIESILADHGAMNFPLETQEENDRLDDEYWEYLSCTGKDYPRFVLLSGLTDTFSPEMPYVTDTKLTSRVASQGEAEEYVQRFDPRGMTERRGSIFEALTFAEKTEFTPTLYIASRPQEKEYSGFLIYRPWFNQRKQQLKAISIVSMGVNADERRQGYGRQLCCYLARMYPSCDIYATLPDCSYSTAAFFKGIGAEIRRTSTCLEARFSLTDLFPMETEYRKQLKKNEKKRKK